MNVVCGGAAAVLLRALQPTQGIEVMAARRGATDLRALCSGPGKLGQALGIRRDVHDGRMLDRPPFELRLAPEPLPVVVGPRIGISKAVDRPWRFGVAGSACLSRRFSDAAG